MLQKTANQNLRYSKNELFNQTVGLNQQKPKTAYPHVFCDCSLVATQFTEMFYPKATEESSTRSSLLNNP